MVQTKRKPQRVGGGLLIKVIILVLLAALSISYINLRKQVAAAEAQRDRYAQQVQKTSAENEALEADIAEGSTSEKMEEIARDQLGWAKSDEYIFYDKRN